MAKSRKGACVRLANRDYRPFPGPTKSRLCRMPNAYFVELRYGEVHGDCSSTPSPRSVGPTLSGHNTAARYYQSLMYDGLRTPEALHKKSCRIRPGLCSLHLYFAEFI